MVIETFKDIETHLWAMANKLRGNLDPSEYKHTVLGLIFLKYVSDSFQEKYNQLVENGDDPEDRDEYIAENIFFVPESSRWSYLVDNAKKPTIGVIIDEAMVEIEKENDTLKGVLPKNYARPELDKVKLGELIDLFSFKIGGKKNQEQDLLGRIYEYFLGNFGLAEGKNSGSFYTPSGVVKLMVNMIEPFKGRVYDPCCGSGGMFVQSARFVEEHAGRKDNIHIYGQEYTGTTWKLAKMNLALRGIDGDLGKRDADTFANDLHKNLKADFILANPPFNMKDYSLNTEDVRWKYGTPPSSNANFAWIQHIISKLSPKGTAAFVMANGTLSADGDQGKIRKAIVDEGLVDCIMTLPPKLFYNTQIPACVWIVSKDKKKRKDKVLFMNLTDMGSQSPSARTVTELTDDAVKVISDTYHNWKVNNNYEDKHGFCREVTIDEIIEKNYVLTTGRYIEMEDIIEEDEENFSVKITRIKDELESLFLESHNLESKILAILEGVELDEN
ncbi:N-6 DNA methylase [Ferdinandcohnia sp. SAFN-114]|uniref:type I restriction-modification system subunit M n=1 Tax=Ferdinandcohnia sp. SAFN-114 TaxID=3387275 RepID=UPI003F7DB0D2